MFTNATHTRSSAARVASIVSRYCALPAWNGEPLMLTISSAPASACRRVGPLGYQMSSQMLTANVTSPHVNTGVSVPAWK